MSIVLNRKVCRINFCLWIQYVFVSRACVVWGSVCQTVSIALLSKKDWWVAITEYSIFIPIFGIFCIPSLASYSSGQGYCDPVCTVLQSSHDQKLQGTWLRYQKVKKIPRTVYRWETSIAQQGLQICFWTRLDWMSKKSQERVVMFASITPAGFLFPTRVSKAALCWLRGATSVQEQYLSSWRAACS